MKFSIITVVKNNKAGLLRAIECVRSGRPILSPYAELGMDVDKPSQLEMLRADLARRSSRG